MSKKISAEIRHQVLLLLRQGARAQSIATQLRLTKSWVQQCQYRFDLGDLTWLVARQHKVPTDRQPK